MIIGSLVTVQDKMNLFKYVEILQSKNVPSVVSFKVKFQYDFFHIKIVNYSETSYIK